MKNIFTKEKDAKKIIEDLKKYPRLKVDDVTIQFKWKMSPEGLKTTTMLKLASTQLKMSPKTISDIAQKLYMGGYISYPRTGATKYSPFFDFRSHLTMFRTRENDFNELEDNVKTLLKTFRKEDIDYSKGEEKGGHQPIIPTEFYKNKYLNVVYKKEEKELIFEKSLQI